MNKETRKFLSYQNKVSGTYDIKGLMADVSFKINAEVNADDILKALGTIPHAKKYEDFKVAVDMLQAKE